MTFRKKCIGFSLGKVNIPFNKLRDSTYSINRTRRAPENSFIIDESVNYFLSKNELSFDCQNSMSNVAVSKSSFRCLI